MLWRNWSSNSFTSRLQSCTFVITPWGISPPLKNIEEQNKNKISCRNFCDEAWWFLSLRVFGLLSSSLLLFPQRFGRYVLWPSSGNMNVRGFVIRANFWFGLSKGLYWCVVSGPYRLDNSCLNFWDKAWWFLSLRVFRTIFYIFIVISTISNNKGEDNSPKILNDKNKIVHKKFWSGMETIKDEQ